VVSLKEVKGEREKVKGRRNNSVVCVLTDDRERPCKEESHTHGSEVNFSTKGDLWGHRSGEVVSSQTTANYRV